MGSLQTTVTVLVHKIYPENDSQPYSPLRLVFMVVCICMYTADSRYKGSGYKDVCKNEDIAL